MPVRALLIPPDGVLWHWPVTPLAATIARRAEPRLAPLLGEEAAAAHAEALIGSLSEARRQARDGSLLQPEYPDALAAAAATLGLEAVAANPWPLWDALQLDAATLGLHPFPDAASTLAWLRGLGDVVVLESGWRTAATVRADLEQFGLAPAPPRLATPDVTGFLLPHPEALAGALRLAEVHTEDAALLTAVPRHIGGARRMGLRVIWKRNGRRDLAPEALPDPPDDTIDDLWELTKLPLFKRFPRR